MFDQLLNRDAVIYSGLQARPLADLPLSAEDRFPILHRQRIKRGRRKATKDRIDVRRVRAERRSRVRVSVLGLGRRLTDFVHDAMAGAKHGAGAKFADQAFRRFLGCERQVISGLRVRSLRLVRWPQA